MWPLRASGVGLILLGCCPGGLSERSLAWNVDEVQGMKYRRSEKRWDTGGERREWERDEAQVGLVQNTRMKLPK